MKEDFVINEHGNSVFSGTPEAVRKWIETHEGNIRPGYQVWVEDKQDMVTVSEYLEMA